MNISSERLYNQHLLSEKFHRISDVLKWFGAIQAQDYYGAKWSIGLRLENVFDKDIELAFNNGEILRTHVMRPTWHFVAPSDIRWMLALTSPKVHAFNGYYYRKSGLDKSIFKKTTRIIEKALANKKQLTRLELNTVLKNSKIPTDKLGLSYIIMQAELDAVICSGPRKGTQFTYMLLEERVPKSKILNREEATAELTKRFFQSHGPATIQDFTWWSGLNTKEAKKGLEANKSSFKKKDFEGKAYWFSKESKDIELKNVIQLLPTFDEYLIAYKDKSAAYEKNAKHDKIFQDSFWNSILCKGKIIGSWRRTLLKNKVNIYPKFFRKLTKPEEEVFNTAVKNYGDFLNLIYSIL